MKSLLPGTSFHHKLGNGILTMIIALSRPQTGRLSVSSLPQTVVHSGQSKVPEFATIHALPLELFQRCFSMLAQDDPPRMTRAGIKYLGWITVCHVCRSWREAAMKLSPLWTRPTLELGPRWFTEMVRRAGSAPLIVRYTRPYLPRSKQTNPFSHPLVRATVVEHLYHLKELFISDSHAAMKYAGLLDALILPAHTLTTIELHAFGAPTPCALPANFLGQAAPCLRNISLHGITGQWGVALRPFRDLLQLDITDVGSSLTSHDDLFDILDASPWLEQLCLLGVTISLPVSVVYSRRLHLPHLKLLKLNGSAVQDARLIQVLDLPDTVQIYLFSIYSSLDNCQTLFSALAQHFAQSTRLSFRRLSLMRATSLVVIESVPYEASESEHELSKASCPALLYLECLEPEDGGHIIRAALETIPYADLTELIITNRDAIPDLWPDVLRPLRRVRYLRIEEDTFDPLARAAIVDGAENGVELFPQLSFLELHHMDLELISFIADGLRPVPVSAALITMLIRRKSLGAPIQRLRLTGCGTPPQLLSHVAEIVPDIAEVKPNPEEEDMDCDNMGDRYE